MTTFTNSSNNHKLRNAILRSVIISVLLAYIIDLALFVIGSASGAKNIYSDWTLYWAWTIISMIIIGLILRSLQIRFCGILLILIVAAIFSGAIWYPLLNTLKIGINNFYGIEYLAASRVPYDVKGALSKEFSFIYKRDDPELNKTTEKLKAKNQLACIKGFIFWQSGIAYGFGQRGLPKFYESRGYRFYRLALMMTVGPLVVVECLLNGTIKTGILLFLLQLGWYFLRKRSLPF